MLSALKKLWFFLELPYKREAFYLFVMILIGTAMEMIGLGLVIPLVALMTSPDQIIEHSAFLFMQDLIPDLSSQNVIYYILSFMVLIYFLKTIFMVVLAWKQAGFNLHVQADLSRRMLRSYLFKPWEAYTRHNSSSYLQNIHGEVLLLMQQGYGPAFEIISNFTLLIAAGAFLFVVEPVGTLIIAACIFFAFLGFQYLSKIRVSHWGEIRKKHEELRMQALQEALNSAKEIRLWSCARYFLKAFHSHSINLVYSGRWQSTLRRFPRYFFEFLAILGLVLAILTMMRMGQAMEDIAPVIALFAAIFIKLMPSANMILSGMHSLRYIEPTIKVVETEFLQDHRLGQVSDAKIVKPFQDPFIRLKDIAYTYQNSDISSLADINLEIPFGTHVSIVGESGAGKSTLVDVILGLLKPSNGEVVVNDSVISDTQHASWHKTIGYVPQSVFLLDDTLRRNIAFGVEDDDIEDAAVARAAQDAQLQDVIEGLKNGLDTFLGENASNLSGGQRQRIALARALYRDPAVLILDEATASLDNKTEQEVMHAVNSQYGTRTIINITHKVDVAEMADVIVRLDGGKIVSISKKQSQQ